MRRHHSVQRFVDTTARRCGRLTGRNTQFFSADGQLMPRSSTSKSRVAFGGMGPRPALP